LNTYEDQSRESLVDVNQNGTFDVGDVIFGFLRIDDKVVPNGAAVPDDDLYAVFTSELVSQVITPIGATQTLYQQTFAPTTVVGLRLTDLIPGLPAVAVGTTPAVAVYEDVGINLITTPPAGASSMLDYFTAIATGVGGPSTLDAIAGFGAAGTDKWTASALVSNAADPIATLALLNTLTTGTPVGALFDVGLSALYLDPSMPGLLPFVPVVNNVTGAVTFHDVGITNGNTSGASDAVGAAFFGAGFMSAGVTFDSADVYPLADNANVSVFPAIPEPVSLLVWGGLIAAVTGASNYRQRSRTAA
jgi:hypothetical protein